jgi:DegV family protein with EDD domain
MGIRIVTDSSCDLPAEVVAKHNITVVPLTIRFGEEEFQTISPKDFWAKCAASPTLPETAAPSPGQFEAAFRQLKAEGATGILVINLSRALSATIQSADLAARAVDGEIKVAVVDSKTVSLGTGLIVVDAATKAAAGASLEELVTRAEDLAERTKVFGVLNSLENLKKGGRIGNAKALLASALAIKPVIEVRDGKVEEGGRQRTRSKSLAFLKDVLSKNLPVESLAVLQADCDDADAFIASLRDLYPGEIVVGDIGAVVGTHAGEGTIGIAFVTPK